jgi:hypothetical protein
MTANDSFDRLYRRERDIQLTMFWAAYNAVKTASGAGRSLAAIKRIKEIKKTKTQMMVLLMSLAGPLIATASMTANDSP